MSFLNDYECHYQTDNIYRKYNCFFKNSIKLFENRINGFVDLIEFGDLMSQNFTIDFFAESDEDKIKL